MSKTVVEEGFIVIIDIRNPFNCLEKDFKLYRSVAEDKLLLSDKTLPGFVKKNHIKNPLDTIVGNFYVTVLVRTQGNVSEKKGD
jgi:hypothetical protein